MRNPFIRGGSLALIAGLSIGLAACSGGSEANVATDANAMDANLMFEEPANDASALESVTNATEPFTPMDNGTDNAANATDPLGETSGGDTGGNTVESNVAGM